MHRQRKTQAWTVFILLLIMFLSVSATGMAQEGTWARKADMKIPRGGLSTAVVDGKIYAIGGVTRVGEVALRVFSTVEVYDPATNKWTERAAMPTKRFLLSTAVVNGKIYAIGGAGGWGDVLSTVEVYDPKRNTWTRHHKAAMPNARWGLATAVVNGKIYHIPSNLVVAYHESHWNPPLVRIWRLTNQSRVGTFPPSTSMAHFPPFIARRW